MSKQPLDITTDDVRRFVEEHLPEGAVAQEALLVTAYQTKEDVESNGSEGGSVTLSLLGGYMSNDKLRAAMLESALEEMDM